MNVLRLLPIKIWLTGLCLLGVFAVGCSLLLDFEECESSIECEQRLGVNAVCDDGICQVPQVPTDRLGGPCQEIIGRGEPDDFYVGVLLPLSGEEAGFGIPLLNAVRVAQGDFNALGGIASRRISLLVCDTEGLDDRTREGAQHLADVGIEAVVGPDFSRQVLDIAPSITIPNNMVLVTPSATAAAIRILDDRDLVWRTVANDAIQGQTLALLVERVVTDSLESNLGDAEILVLARDEDAYASGLLEGIASTLPRSASGETQFTSFSYPAAWQEFWVRRRAEIEPPDVVVMLGASEVWSFAEEIDDFFDSEPQFVFADAAKNAQEASATDPNLIGRVVGTAPLNVGDSGYIPYQSFRAKYRSEFEQDPDQFQFVANAFDALFVIGLGAAAEGFTGPEIAEGMKRLSDTGAEAITGDQTGATQGIEILRSGGNIDYQGASGPLNFDETGEPDFTAIALWCFTEQGVPEAGLIYEGVGKALTDVKCSDLTSQEDPDMGHVDAGVDMGVDTDATNSDSGDTGD